MPTTEAPRFAGPDKDIPFPPFADIPPALDREIPIKVAVIAEEALTPIGNTADETWEALKMGISGIERRLYPPYTDPKIDPDTGKEVLAAQIRCTTAGTIKNFNPVETLRGILPAAEVKFKMDPYAHYAVYTGVGAARKVFTFNGIPLVIPRIGEDGQVDKKYPLTINPELIHPSHVGIYAGCGFGGGDVSAEVMDRLLKGKIASGDHMLRELIDRASSQTAKALNAHGGAEGDVAACSSSGKALINAINAIMMGQIDVAIVIGTEGILNKPIGSHSFDTMSALDKGVDPLKTSLSLHQIRNGFVPADGAIALVLASWDWVRRHGVNVLYEIIGIGNTADAWDDTRPNGIDGERALRFSRRMAERWGKIEGKVIDSGHYTATPAGDDVEFLHTINAYEDLARAGKLIHGATKRVTGHMLGAAGLMSQFAVGRALQESWVFPTTRAGELMPVTYGYDIPQEASYEPDLTDGVSKSFGFGGSNVAINSRRVR